MAKTKREPKSLFRKLTRLFRSGPLVKRKIKGLDTTLAVADKSKSSGTLLFQKSLSPTYATITSNAYNLSERLMRYQDFQEMEYTPEIAAAMDIYCITKDAMISTPYGDFSVSNLLKQQQDLSTSSAKRMWQLDPLTGSAKFPVYCYDANTKCIVIGWAHSVRKTGDAAKIVEVKLDNEKSIRCTPSHRFMLRDGTWCRAAELKNGDSLMPFTTRWMGRKGHEYQYIYTMDRTKTKSGWRAQHLFNVENLVRGLRDDEVVHHKDFDRSNNCIDNLEIMNEFDHSSYHARLNNENKLGSTNDKHGLWMMNNNPVKIDVPTEEQLRAHCGMTINDVALEFNTTYSVLQEWVRKFGYSNWTSFKKESKSHCIQSMTRLTSSLTVDEIKKTYVLGDTKAQLVMKLGCTVNVFDKFLNRKIKKSWSELAAEMGGSAHTFGGRPKGSYSKSITFQNICDAMNVGTYLTQEQLSEKLDVSTSVILTRLASHGYATFSDWQKSYHNHKVVSVSDAGTEDVYDITTDVHHNFACNGIIVHNSDETVAADDKGRCLHVYSDNEKIKEVLEDLFYNVLNVEFNLRSWARNLVKYGDFFLYNDVSPEYGVVNAFPIPVNEIEREENYDRDDPFAVRFRWVTLGNRTLENWEVTHFRLLGNDMFLPYGSSVIEPARRIWRQLILIEDAMLVYRVVRAPERRVFYIDVANLPAEDVGPYVEEQKKNLRTSQVVDQTTGRVDLRYNPLCLDLATCIKLQDGRSISLSQIIEEHALGKELWVHSIDVDGRKIVPGKVSWAGITRRDADLVRVTLDDGSYVDATPDHRFMLRDGSYIKAEDLNVGQPLMPLYTYTSARAAEDYLDGYEMQYDPFDGRKKYTHRVNADVEALNKRSDVTASSVVVHHSDFNKRNNSPDNLFWMGFADHRDYHSRLCNMTLNTPELLAKRAIAMSEYNKGPAHRKRTAEINVRDQKALKMGSAYNGSSLHASHNDNRRAGQHASWTTPKRKQKRSEAMRYVITDEMFMRIVDIVRSNPKLTRGKLHEKLVHDAVFAEGLKNQKLGRPVRKFSHSAWVGALKRKGFVGFGDFRSSLMDGTYKNHTVASVERLSSRADTGCITVEKWHNFAVCGKLNDPTSEQNSSPCASGVFVHNSVDEDYFIPVRGGESGTKIDTLAGGQNTGNVEDVAYIQKKLFAALKIPRAYLGYDEMLSSKATLAQEDIRFSRTINVIQKVMLAELNKLAIIHMYAHGYDGEDLQNFTLRLSNPSTVAQQQKLELWRSRFEIAGTAPEGMVSKAFVRREVLGLNHEDVDTLDDERLQEKLVDNLIEAGGDDGSSAAGGGGSDAGGGDDDIFGDETGEEEAPAGEETPPEENAGEEPEEERSDRALITSTDDPDDDENFSLKVPTESHGSPVKVQKQLQKVLYNRGRRRTHGASKTHMPNFNDMTNNDSKAMNDPYDNDFLKSITSNPLGEASNYREVPIRFGPDLTSTLRRMSTKFSINRSFNDNLLHEGIDVQDEIDAENSSTEQIVEAAGTASDEEVFIIDDEDDEGFE